MYEALIKELNSFMELTGKSQKQVAKEATLSNAVISQFLDGRYTGDNKKVAEILTKYLELSEKRKFNISHARFSENLNNTKTVLFTYRKRRNRELSSIFRCDKSKGLCKRKQCPEYNGCTKSAKKQLEAWNNAFRKLQFSPPHRLNKKMIVKMLIFYKALLTYYPQVCIYTDDFWGVLFLQDLNCG